MKSHNPQLDQFNSPCTIAEAVQISRASAEDVVNQYNSRVSHLQVAISLQIEILKDIVIKAGLITEEEFRSQYIEKAEEFNKMQQMAEREAQDGDNVVPFTAKMNMSSTDIEVKKD